MAASDQSRIETDTALVDGIRIALRRVRGEGAPVVFFHGVPTSSADWLPFLERVPGPAIAFDLPGFGASERVPPERFPATMDAYIEFIRRALDELGVGEYSLVAHDWGGLGLFAALAEPERVRRVVAINITPLAPGYRWHRTARMWRTRSVGELLNRLWSRPMLALSLREARGDWSPMPKEFVDMVMEGVDRGTLDAILRLYRSGPEEKLVAAARGIDDLTAPALVIWGLKDRYVGGDIGAPTAAVFPNADLIELPGAGHWPWTEQPGVVDTVVEFLEA